MNFERIQASIDVHTMQESHCVAIGGAYGLVKDLAHSGLGSVTLMDFDVVSGTNPARQDFYSADLGRRKTEVTARDLKMINPDIEVECVNGDFCSMTSEEVDEHFGHTDLFIFAADSFPAQARGSKEAVRLNKPALWIGLYRGGRAGEIIYYVPDVTPACFRCICSSRYEAFRRGQTQVSSEGGTILDLHLVDAIAGQIAVGILTRGADNRMGRLINQLGNRNLLQVKMDPEYRLGDRDIFREYLGDGSANFSFTTIALPMERELDCPDCSRAHVREEAR